MRLKISKWMACKLGKTVMIALVTMLIANMTSAQTMFSGGNGTEAYPFLISSKADMETLANAVNNGNTYSGKYFLLTQDLKLYNTITTVIGITELTPFSGNFDGGGHDITMSINKGGSTGVFCAISGAYIQNLSVSGNNTTSGNAGGICAYALNNSTITNCNNTVEISIVDFLLGECSGGICAIAENSNIINCYSTGNISAIDPSGNFNCCSGGICATASNCSIANCYNRGKIVVSVEEYSYSGGICAYALNTQISNCYNKGDVSASSTWLDSHSGGICAYTGYSQRFGNNKCRITNCYSLGKISSSKRDWGATSYAGGISGESVTTNIEDCFAANTNILSTNIFGRICGDGSSTSIANCYALSSILLNNYFAFDKNSAIEKNGQDVDLAALQTQSWISANLGWDFTAVWKQRPNEFPIFMYQNDPSNIIFSIEETTYGEQKTLNATSDNTTTPIVYTSSDNTIAEVSGNILTAKKAGTVIITAGQEASNGFAAGQTSVNLTVRKKDITITANDASMVYGDTPPIYTCWYSGFVNNENESVLLQQPALASNASVHSNVNTYAIVPSGAEAQNYAFIYVNGILTISKAPLTIMANNAIRKQGEPNPIFTLSYSGFKNNENYSVLDKLPTAVCTANENSPAGYYDIVLSGGSDKNYSYALFNGTLEVSAATGIDNFSSSQISVYPNPTKEAAYIKGAIGKNVVIYDNLGSLIREQKITSDAEKISLSSWSEGVYLFKIIENGKVLGTIKLIKK